MWKVISLKAPALYLLKNIVPNQQVVADIQQNEAVSLERSK